MAMQEQERGSPPLETARTASDEPQRPGLGPIAWRSAATMPTGAMAGGGGAGQEERGPEGAPDNVRSSSSRVALLSVVSFRSLLTASPEFQRKSPFKKFQRKPRSHGPRAAPSHPWGFKLPVLPPAPAKKQPAKKAWKRTAKKRDKPCALCGATKTPLWRTWPTDRRVMLCNACGIRVRAPGAVLPELLHLPPPATVVSELEQPPTQEIQPVSNSPGAVLPEQAHLPPPATKTTTVVSELELPSRSPQEIQDSESPPGSPILDSMLDFDVYLLKRTSPRRQRSPPPPPPQTAAESAPAAAAPAPVNENDKQEKWCLHCGTTSSLQWRTGPMGASTLCNPCGVRYRQGRLVPEYRPRASPTFNQAEHSYKHREVIQIRKMQDHPAPPAPFQPSRTRKRRKGKRQQQKPALVRKKRKGNKEQNQPAQAQPAAAVAVLQVRKKSKGKAQRLPPEPALLKLRKEHKGKEQHRRPPQPAAAQHLPPPPPPALLPHAGVDMVLQNLPPPPPPTQPHAGYEMLQYLPPPPPALPHAADDMEMEQHRLLPLPPALPHAGDDNYMEQHLLPPPPAQPHAGDELVTGEPIPPPDPFLFDGPAAPRIIDDDEPVIVIMIDDD